MGGVESAGVGVHEVAALGDRQRNDADGGVGHLCEDGVGIDFAEVDHRAGDARRQTLGVQLHDSREPVLRRQRSAAGGVERLDARADDGPVVPGSGREQAVEIDGHMRAVKVADADVQDAGRQVGAGVSGGRNTLRQAAEGR